MRVLVHCFIALALGIAVDARKAATQVLKDPATLRTLGLETHAERAELHAEFKPLANRIGRLENILKTALNGDYPRPVDEAQSFAKCGCAEGGVERTDGMTTPSVQAEGLFERTAGVPGLRCLRKEVHTLPNHNEDLCGPLCYPITVEKLNPATHASYATLCPAPMVADCSWSSKGLVSNCAYPFTAEMSLKARVALLEIGAMSYQQKINWKPTSAVTAKTGAEFTALLDIVEETLLSSLTAAAMPKPTGAMMKRCGCAAWSDDSSELKAATHNVRLSPASKANPLGWLCEFADGGNYESACGPICKVSKSSTGPFAGKKVVHFCPAGTDTQCTGCAPPSVVSRASFGHGEL